MAKLFGIVFILCIFIFSIQVMAMEFRSPEDKSLEISLEQKIRTSFVNAQLVLLGSFRSLNDSQVLESLSDEESFLYVEFSINNIYKGEIHVDTMKLKIPICTVTTKESSKTTEYSEIESIKQLSQQIKRLERQLEGGLIEKSKYIDDLKNMRMQILHSPDYSRDKIIIVSIKRGGLDYRYRLADVPIEFGKKYILFVCKDINEHGATDLFPWDLDLYPDDKLHVIENVMKIIKK